MDEAAVGVGDEEFHWERDDEPRFDGLREFEEKCQRMEANDPLFTKYHSFQHVNHDQIAHRIGQALIGNTHVNEMTLFLKHGVRPNGAIFLSDGILQSRVKVLNLWKEDDGDEVVGYVAGILCIRAIESLTTLRMEYPLDDLHALRFAEELALNQSLERIQISVKPTLTLVGAQALATGIRTSRITSLEFNSNDVRGNDFTAIMRTFYLQGCDNIQHLLINRVVGDVDVVASSVLPKLCSLEIMFFTLSPANVQAISHGARLALQLTSLILTDCKISEDDMLVLLPILAAHPTLECVGLRNNQLGDEGIASFVEHWHSKSFIREMDFSMNLIGPKGAQRLIRAIGDEHHMTKINLEVNRSIGHDGIQLMCKELPGKHITELSILAVAPCWVVYPNIHSDESKLQTSTRDQTAQALLHGVRGNVYIQELIVPLINLSLPVTAELELFLEANRRGRALLLGQHDELPSSFWSHFLAKQSHNASFLFLFLRELPTIWM